MDTSIYDEIKSEILESLREYEKIEKIDTVLFLIDSVMHKRLLEYKERLEIEYGYDEGVLKNHSLDSIVKHLNLKGETHTYSLTPKTYFVQISDQEKVEDRLEREFSIWKNRLLKEVGAKLTEKGLKGDALAKKNLELNGEIEQARVHLKYIQENFDLLDVKITSFLTRPSQGVEIRFRIGDKQVATRLKSTIANVLFFKEKAPQVYPNNKLAAYLEEATHAFGDVYYRKNNE